MYFKNQYYDSSEIAEDLFNVAKMGQILEITGGNSLLQVEEYGELKRYYYHQVFSDGKYIYDPRYSDNPVLEYDYLEMLRKMNEGKINVEIVDEE